MYITTNLSVEAILHTPLISSLRTLKPEGHRNIAEGSKGSNEHRLLLVLNCHLDLMITRIGIQKTQTLATCRSINDLINTGESKRIRWTGFIQVCVIHTHAPGAIFLKNQHRISKPLMMKNFNNKPSCQEPGHFLTNRFTSFFVKPAQELFHRFVFGIHIKSVLSESPRYTRHVRRLPCE